MILVTKQRLIFSSFLLALLLVAVLGQVTYRQARANELASRLVDHTRTVDLELAHLVSLVQDLTGAARSYAITGDEAYRMAFRDAEQVLKPVQSRLRELVRDNPGQLERLEALTPLIDRRVALSLRIIDLRRTAGEDRADQLITAGEGQQVTAEARRVINTMRAAEDTLLVEQLEALRGDQFRTRALSLALVAGLGVLLLLALRLSRANLRAQERTLAVTERARAHAAQIVDTIHEPLLVLDTDLRVLSANRSYYQTFRSTPAETEGQAFPTLAGGAWDIPELRQKLEAVVPSQSPFEDFGVERDFPQIGRRALRLSARKIFRVGNHTTSLLLVLEDVTETRDAVEDRDRFYSLSRELVCVAGFDGYLKRVNPAWESVTGFTEGELLVSPFLDFIHPEDRRATAVESRRHAQGHDTSSFENRWRCKDGSYRWLLWNATSVPERRQVFATAHDITARKAAESRLHQSHRELQDRFERAVRASGQLLYERSAAGAIAYHGTVESLGYSPAELGSGATPWLDLIHPDDRATFTRELARCLGSGAPFLVEYRVRRKDGEYVPVEDRGFPLAPADGRPGGLIGFVADVSQRRSLEEQFRQAQKMEAVGRLAGGIAHDFNNLLGVIIGFSDLLQDELAGHLTGLEHVTEIRKAAVRAANLTRQLLAFSRKQVLTPRLLDLNEIIEEQGGMLERLVGEEVTLVARPTPGLGSVRADRGQVEQVVLNLVVNALDAMPRGGTLRIETANVDLDTEYARTHVGIEPGSYVMLAVSDTGTGMNAETQARLFEPFFTTKAEGTGLGLATVYGIVKQSGGGIWVYSELGRGTTFKVYLPLVAVPVDHDHAPVDPREVEGGRETILLAEDSDALRAVTRQFLDRAGYEVLEAPDGAAAVSLMQAHQGPLHLVLTDVVMPALSGGEVARAAKRLHPGVRVIFMSGYTDDAIVHHGVLEPGTSILHKPFGREALLAKVRSALDA